MYNVSLTGLGSNKTQAAAASPTVSIAFGAVTAASPSIANGLWKSTNNINWSIITTAPNTAIYSAAYGNNTFVAVGASGVIFTSPGTDGETWTAQTKAGASSTAFNKVTFVNGLFFAQQGSTNMQYSSDGVTWALVSGVSAGITIDVASPGDFGSWYPSLVYSKGIYIWFSGSTATTGTNRIYLINESSITTGSVNWANNFVNTASIFRHGRQDPGDGFGPFINIRTDPGFVRVNTSGIDGQFQTSSFAAIHTQTGDGWQGAIDAPGATASAVAIYSKAGAYTNLNAMWNGLYYNEGWYTSVFPAVMAKSRFQQISTGSDEERYSVGVSNWHENEFYPGQRFTSQGENEENRASIFPGYVVTAGAIGKRFNFVEEWEQNGKKIVFLPSSSTTSHQSGGIMVLIGSRAIRPLRTTINEKVG
jgi:hypothetical protein